MSSGLTRRDLLGAAGLTLGSSVVGRSARPWSRGGQRRRGREGGHPNFIVLVFDTLSAYQMSLHGYRRATTPNFGRLAEQATVYHTHYAGGNFTTPGTASLLTGMLPWTHRAMHVYGTMRRGVAHRNIFGLLPEHYHTVAYTHNRLARLLLEQCRAGIDRLMEPRELAVADYQLTDRGLPGDHNLAWSTEWRFRSGAGQSLRGSLLLSTADQLWQLFGAARRRQAELGQRFPDGVPHQQGLVFTLERVVDWLVSSAATMPSPAFVYCHVLPPHDPYLPRRDFIDAFRDGWSPAPKPAGPFTQEVPQAELDAQRRRYDAYLAYADAELGRLLDELARDGMLDDTWLIVTSDHGELFERGIRGHTTSALYEPIIRIPLLIRRPGQTARQDIRVPTSCVDLVPTLLRASGQPLPAWRDGRVLPGLGLDADVTERPVFAVEAQRSAKLAPLRTCSLALIRGRWKLTGLFGYDDDGPPQFTLYDLVNDPEEREDLYDVRRAVARELRAELEGRLRAENERLEQVPF